MAPCTRVTGHAAPSRVNSPILAGRLNGRTREDGRLIVVCGSPSQWTVTDLGEDDQRAACTSCLGAVVDAVGGEAVVIRTRTRPAPSTERTT